MVEVLEPAALLCPPGRHSHTYDEIRHRGPSSGWCEQAHKPYDIAVVPEINLAMKQMCVEALRGIGELSSFSGPVLTDLLKLSHCWCSIYQIPIGGKGLAVDHHVCCKCGDRYKAEKGE